MIDAPSLSTTISESVLDVFIRRKDRVTIQERERIEEETNMTEDKHKKMVDDRKRQSTKVWPSLAKVESGYYIQYTCCVDRLVSFTGVPL